VRSDAKRMSRKTSVRWRNYFSDNLKSKIQKLKWAGIITFVITFAFAMCGAVGAQPMKAPRIGHLNGSSLSAIAYRIEAFRQGLRELGYVEGKNIVIECRSAEQKFDRLPALAAELVRLKVDIIVTSVRYQPAPPRKQLLRFPLSWRRIPIPLEMGLSPALHDQAGTLLDYQILTGS
jgi:hypothetical protein